MTKKMEDFVVKGDGSVRDSDGCIVQFQYGDDGMDPINIINCSGAAFPLALDVKREAKRFSGANERELSADETNLILSQLRVGSHVCELTELHSAILQEEYRKQFNGVKIEPIQIPAFARRVFDRHGKAGAAYGTSVGLIAACALGEPVTQQTLNSVVAETLILVEQDNKEKVVRIGDYIDDLMRDGHQVINDSDYIDVSSKNIYIPSPTKDGHMKWCQVTAATRHKPIARLVEIQTEYGRSVIAAEHKSFLVYREGEFRMTDGSNLNIGDKVPVTKRLPKREGVIPYDNILQGQDVAWEMCCHYAKHGVFMGVKKNKGIMYFPDDTENMNDVVLDTITSIEFIDPDPEERVYDFTVPETLFFSLFNGLGQGDTFHSSGLAAKDVTLGLPRLNELLNTTKKPSRPVVQVLFREKETVETLSRKRKLLEGITVNKLLTESNPVKLLYIEKDVPEGCPSEFITEDKYEPPEWGDLVSLLPPSPILPNNWVIRLRFSLEKLYDLNLSLKEVADAIADDVGDGVSVVRSPLIFGEIEVYTDTAYVTGYARDKVVSTDTHLTEENMAYYLTRSVVMRAVLDTQVCGVRGVTKTTVREDDGKDCPYLSQSSAMNKEWVIDAAVGDKDNTYLGILCRATDLNTGIDGNRTWSTDLWETLDILGIEATRALLYSEFNKIIGFDGTYVNPRHLQLLIDSMTRNGGLTSVRRDGITEETGVLAQGLFEKAIDNFSSAAMFGRSDELRGLSGSVMMGSTLPAGTGAVVLRSKDDAVI